MINWIKTSVENPNDNRDVLVYNPKDGITIGCYFEQNVNFYYEADGSKFYTDCGWEACYSWAERMSPTHWAELPLEPNIED
jgi:hypothetical protein